MPEWQLREMDAGEGHRARGTGDRPEERDREKGKGAIAKGCEAIGRFGTVSAKAGKTYRLRMSPGHLPVGAYTVRMRLARTGGSVSRTLLSRRL